MKKLSHFLFLLLAAFLPAACEKDITVDLPEVDKKVVVDGSIFVGEYASVSLTYSFPFFTDFSDLDFTDPAQIDKFIVTDAVVTLSDGSMTETLGLSFDNTKFPPLLYKGDSIVGQPGKSYQLTISTQGKTYTANTYIPQNIVALDSIKWFKDANSDSLGSCRLYFQDPPAPGNIYRLFAKRQGYANYAIIPGNSVIDDQAYNGTYIEFPFVRPEEQSSIFTANSGGQDDPTRYKWVLGDSVYVRFASIDAISYDYIRTLEQAAGISGNPFSNPVTVKGNVTGGALGGFVGYAQMDIWRKAE